jgi:DNA-binding FadR family transcriptional regulator
LETLASFASYVTQDRTALDLLQVRRLLEPPATGLAAGVIGSRDVRELGEILDRSEVAGSAAEFARLDTAFHTRIVDLVGNPVLSVILQATTERLRVLRGEAPHPLEQSYREHRAILEALASHDTQVAAAAATVHVSGAEQRLR